MSDLLAAMERSSARRAAEARAAEPLPALRRRALEAGAPPPLRRAGGFDLIAEVKRRSPSEGDLAPSDEDAAGGVAARAAAYARAGAAAVSVLTEPERFGGDLAHLARAAAALPVPAMRKDFLVDPYQVFEARAAGAGGVLLILRLLDDRRLGEALDAAREAGLFVLLEAFDADDLARAGALDAPGDLELLVGLNTRDLRTLAVDAGRLQSLAGSFPPGRPRVAESGLQGPDDAARAARLGYDLALVGSALMRAARPEALVADLLAAGRAAAADREGPCASG